MAEAHPRVIVIGGGPNGITVAHALYHAGIDFLVLEKRDNVIEDTGASLVLNPPSLRVFHQFGLLERLQELGAPVALARSFTRDGRAFKRSASPQLIAENYGGPILAFHRAHLLEALYQGLPEAAKSRCLTGKKIIDIALSPTGVTVSCSDDTTYAGTIVIGADGVRSKARTIMRRLAVESDLSLSSAWDANFPFTSYYRCLWASFPRLVEAEPNAACNFDTQGHDRSVMYISGVERSWIFLYEKLPEPVRQHISYSDAEVAAFAESFANWPITEALRVRDVYVKRFTAGMANLEEGIVKRMSWGGRIVLVGDAAHKFTPNAGFGFNNGVQDIVALCNRLHEIEFMSMGENGPSSVAPDASVLQDIFEAYQRERHEPLTADYRYSAHLTRLHAWANYLYYFVSRWILSREFVQNFLVQRLTAHRIKSALVLSYVAAVEPFRGKVGWNHPMKECSS